MKKIVILSILMFVGIISYSCKNANAQQSEDYISSEPFQHKIPGDGSKTCSPYFFIKTDDPDHSQMPLYSTKVDVKITGVIANVSVKQVYVNNSKKKLDAIYIFPGSTRAAVYGLDMIVGKRVIHAKVKEKEQARKEFEQAKREGKRSTLLEQDRPNVFKTELANIQPGETITVELFYTELLEYKDKEYEFVYPTAVGPRYSTKHEEFVEYSIAQWIGSNKSTFDIQVAIDGAVPVQSVSSSSHQIKVNKENDHCTKIALTNPKDVNPGSDFILRYGLQGERVESGLTLYEHGDEKFFLLMMQPPKNVKNTEILPREYIFIVDVSGSMLGFPLEVSKTILKKLISSLRPEDRFNVMLFESSNSMLSKTSLPATSENIEKAIKVIDNQEGGGGTELYPALQKAFNYKDPKTKNYARTFIIATDGFVTVESETFRLISENLNQASFVPIGIGRNVNRYLIEGIAWAGSSEPFIIKNQTEAEKVGEHFIKTISQPILSDISIDWGGFDVYDVYPQKIPDIFTERPVVVFGKYKESASGTIVIKGKTAEGALEQFIPLNEAVKSDNEALRYLWARNKIKYLSDYAGFYEDTNDYVEDESDIYFSKSNKEEITRLGLKYNLLTAFTSFLAVDQKTEKYSANRDSQTIAPVASYSAQECNKTMKEYIDVPASEQVFEMVEQMPQYPGGEKELIKNFMEKFQYPANTSGKNISGRIILRFKVTETGEITDVEVVKSLDPAYDKEAVRVIKSLPKWIPGRQNGKAVAVYYSLPVTFK